MSAATDEELAAAFQDGLRAAEAAFGQLHARHAPRLLEFLRTRLAHAAEDVHQEVWLRVWRSLSRRFQGGNFRAWLFEVAHNCQHDWQRRNRRHNAAAPFDDGRAPPEEWARPAAGAPPEEQERLEQRTRALRRCLRELEADDAEAAAVVRGRMDGQDYERICHDLGLKRERAHRLFHEASRRLRQCLERAGP